MNGSTENRASGASEKPGRTDTVLSLTTAHRMLPLVQRIVDDILHHRKLLAKLRPAQTHLDRHRHTLTWPERQRRYLVKEEIALAEHNLLDALAELEVLGIALVDGAEGRVGFPTVVNDRRAFFSWKPTDASVAFWHFANETTRRPIPPHWIKMNDVRLLGKS